MKKVLLSVAAMAMMGMMMTSCQKEEGLSKDTFTATTENGGSKTHLDGLNLKWDDEGESIMVMGENMGFYASMAEYVATSVTNGNTCATFACQEGSEVTATDNKIYYPASLITNISSTPQLPAEQEYAANNVKGFPMYAETQSHAFQFTNLCGLFRLQLQKTGVTVSSITITTDKAVNGAFAVGTNAEGAFQFEAYETSDDAQKSVTLTCGNGVSIDELTDFNIYLPAGEYSTFDITIRATDGTQCVKSLNGNAITINRNERVTLTREGDALEFVDPFGHLPGLFSVSDTKQVYFATGNLQYVEGQWRFAEHQYDYLGTYSATAWDMFGWSTAATNFGMSTSNNWHDYSGDFVDWGTQIGDGHTWRTLSIDEWRYMINSRDDDKKGLATITIDHNEIPGMVLLPDADFPNNLRSNFNSSISSWTNNRYTAAQWEQMEAAGAVFFPATGYRDMTNMYIVGERGLYWTSTPDGSSEADNMYFDHFEVYCNDYRYRYCGLSVRLVQEYHNN